MGEANGRFVGMIDTSVSDKAIQKAKREFARLLSERLIVAMAHGIGPSMLDDGLKAIHDNAWKLAEMHYDEFMRREALPMDVTLTDRMAAQNIVAGLQ